MKKIAPIFVIFILLTSCRKHSSDNPPPAPGQAALFQPADNSACTTGIDVTNDESTIAFAWNASPNTDSYELHITDLLNNTKLPPITTSQTGAMIPLSLNTPFSWYVVSISNKSSATMNSDTWKFYNSGPGTVSFAPFPAEISSPSFGVQVTAPSGTINLSWIGTSVENDILNYDVYFDTKNPPALLKDSVNSSSLNVPVKSGDTYFWRIITRDAKGNTSDSGVFQFSVK